MLVEVEPVCECPCSQEDQVEEDLKCQVSTLNRFCGLYYRHVTIINYASRDVSE